MSAHRLISVAASNCPTCGVAPIIPAQRQRVPILGVPASDGVQVCEACFERWLRSCPRHDMPRSNSRAKHA